LHIVILDCKYTIFWHNFVIYFEIDYKQDGSKQQVSRQQASWQQATRRQATRKKGTVEWAKGYKMQGTRTKREKANKH
jgi:hypothetical protein